MLNFKGRLMNKKTLIFAFLAIFFFSVGFVAMQKGKPEPKNERIYALISEHSPYYLEKRMGGLSIVNKTTGEKEKPSASEVFKKFEHLEKIWGKKHLKIDGDFLVILDENGNKKSELVFHTEDEKEWIKKYFGI